MDEGRRFIAVLVLTALLFAFTDSATGLDATLGDHVTCSVWLQQRDKEKSWVRGPGRTEMPKGTHLPSVWLIGFIEGYNWACLMEKPLASGLDTEGILERVDSICRSKPGDTLLRFVAINLVAQLQQSDIPGCPLPSGR